MSARPPEKGDSILNGHSDASRGVLQRVRLTSTLGGNVAEGYACGPFGDMRTGETPLPVVAHRRTARSPSPYFRKVCRSRLRSHLPQIQPLTRSPRTCFEGPFGEVIRATGPMAKANPFRFSTKYQDDETDLLYYGYRYYNPSTGKWNSRDPLEEAGGFNLYGMVRNNAVNRIDRLGLDDGDSFFMMFIEFLTHTGDSTFTGYSDSIWNSILEHEEVLNLYTKVMSEATHMRTCCKTSRKKIPGGNLIFRESFFRWGSWGGFNAGVAIGTGTLDVGTIPLVVKCDDKQCSWRADFMFTLKDKYSFRSYDDSGVEHPWYTIEDNNWVLRYFSPTIFLIIGKDFDIADKRFLTKTGTFPCHRN